MNFVLDPHSFAACGIRNYPWHVCKKCGLVRLRNAFTQWATKQGCNNEDHPDYPKWLAKTDVQRKIQYP